MGSVSFDAKSNPRRHTLITRLRFDPVDLKHIQTVIKKMEPPP
jgi:hypothetical protein